MNLIIEVDPAPVGYRYTGDFRRVAVGEHYAYEGEAHKSCGESGCYLILEKVEPKRESRWINAYGAESEGYASKERAEKQAWRETRKGCLRLDYEDGKLVAVTLEPEGEVRDE